MSKIILLVILLIYASFTCAMNYAVCTAEYHLESAPMGVVTVKIDEIFKSAQVSWKFDGITKMSTFTNLTSVWDGHLTGIVTGENFSFKYNNNYGCFSHAFLHAVVESKDIDVAMDTCKGPDPICP